MNKKFYFVAIALLASSLVSCVKEDNNFISSKNNGKVGVVVSGADGVSTKAGATAELLGSATIDGIDGQAFRLDMYVEDNYLMPFSDDAQTKGSIVTSDGINVTGKQFAFNGWLGSENRFPNDVDNGRTYDEGGSTGRLNNETDATNFHFLSSTATKGSSDWTLDPTTPWRNAVPSTFWSWYPITDAARTITLLGDKASDADQAKLSFTYNTPSDVAAQNDLLFAYNLHTVSYDDAGNTTDSEMVSINFYHALAAIRFDVAGALTDNITINSIFFKGLTLDGTCDVNGSDSGNKAGKVAFVWTPGTTTGTISQNVVPGDFTETGLDGETENALMPTSSSKFFFFIPQAVTGKVEIGVTFTRADGAENTRTFELDHAAWEAGKIYTYKLNPAGDYVDVDIIETVSAKVKSDVSIKNTGNVYEYLRVAIIGNWSVSDSENETLVGAWNFDSSAFTGLNVGTGNSQWTIGSDGFFYSNAKVAPGESLDLFDSYTAPAFAISNATLNLNVMSQAVAAGQAADWAAAVAAAMRPATTE